MMRILLTLFTSCCLLGCGRSDRRTAENIPAPVQEKATKSIFKAPDTTELQNDAWGRLVKYGARLVRNTGYYIGPEGVVSKNLGNKMNCTHCHQEAGTKPFGLNFFDSHRIYPQYRARENTVLTMSERVNNCIERPHNGKPLPLGGEEMRAIVSYIKWLGEKYDPEIHEGYGLVRIDYDSLRADSRRGQQVYTTHCQSCHQADGQGQMNVENTMYVYPPLWGPKSYQEGSSMHRVIKAARFIKANMPHLIASYDKPLLTDQEALDVAAFINDGSIHPRPKPNALNYPNIETKPIDYFKGPYRDGFSEDQHTFGPWYEIEEFYVSRGLKVNK